MKIRNIIMSLLACLSIFISCVPETRPVFDEIKLGQSYVGFGAEGGKIETTLKTTDEWEITGMTADDTWLTIDPISGAAGEYKLTFTAEALAEGSRELNLVLECAGKEQKIIVKQSAGAAEVKIYTIAEILKFTDAEIGKIVAVKGAVARITGPTYGEFYMKDTEGNELLIYNSQPSFDEIQPAVGDIVTVEGPFTIYKGTYELNKGSKIIAIERSLIQLPANAYEVEVPGAEISVPALVKGEGLKVTVDEKSGSWVTYQGSVPGEDGMVNLLFVVASNYKSGPRTATVTLSTVSGKATSESAITFSQKGDIPDTQITVSQFVKEKNDAWVSLKGVVTGVHKKGFILTDAENNSLYVYPNDKPSVKIGDEVIATGNKGSYNKCLQLANPIVEKVASDKAPYYPTPVECTDALMEEMEAVTDPVLAKYVTVTAVPSGQYGDLNFGTDSRVSPYQTSDEFNYPANFEGKKVTLKGYVIQVKTGELRVLPVSIEEASEETPALTVDGKQWLAEMNGVKLLVDLGASEEGMMMVGVSTDGVSYTLYENMLGAYEAKATDATSGTVVFTPMDLATESFGAPVSLPYSALTETSVSVTAPDLFGEEAPVPFTKVSEYIEIAIPGLGDGEDGPSGNSIASGVYWIATPDLKKVAAPFVIEKSYGYLPVEDMVEGASYAKNAFKFTYNADETRYTIQDSFGRYLYAKFDTNKNAYYNSFNVSETIPETGAYWSVEDRGDGTYDIYNGLSNFSISYTESFSTWGARSPEDPEFSGIYPTLVKADNPLPDPQPEQPTIGNPMVLDVKTIPAIMGVSFGTGSYGDYASVVRKTVADVELKATYICENSKDGNLGVHASQFIQIKKTDGYIANGTAFPAKSIKVYVLEDKDKAKICVGFAPDPTTVATTTQSTETITVKGYQKVDGVQTDMDKTMTLNVYTVDMTSNPTFFKVSAEGGAAWLYKIEIGY